MKVGQLISQYFPQFGGAEVCVHNVCESLHARGHEAVIVCTTPADTAQPPVLYKVERLFSKTWGLLSRDLWIGKVYLHWALGRLQRKHRFDLWQVTNGYPLGVHAVDFFKRNHLPCVLRCCGDDIQRFPQIAYGNRLDPAVDSLTRRKYPLFDGFAALTPSVLREYRELGIPDNKVRVIPNGVSLARFAAAPARTEARASLGLPTDKTILLTVGRYHPKKGFDLIPEIARLLRADGLDFIWIVAGGGCGQLELKFPECQSLGIQTMEKFAKSGGAKSFHLPSQELVTLYKAADVFSFPTLIETFGMVVVEAMAAGLPIVTTNAEGVRDVVQHDYTGLQASPGDPAAFASLLRSVMTNPELNLRLSRASLAEAKNYDWPLVTASYIELYKKVVKEHGL